MENVKVRRATGHDAEEILRLIKELAAHHNAPEMVTWTADEMRRIGLDAENPSFEAFVAENKEGNILGCAVYFERFSTWKGPTIHIEDLMISPEYRGMHIGEALLDAVIDTARQRGINRIELDVEGNNEGAIRFYNRKGFDTTWRAGKLYLDGGQH